MAKPTKIKTLAVIREIPFNQLVLSQANVRTVKTGVSIEELSEDIARRGLLQNLYVRPVIGADGEETGFYEVPAGGRRYRALERLVKAKRLDKAVPVPCIIRDTGIAEEDFLAENTQREALHPVDQFRAFQTLIDKGLTEDDIAARFFVTPQIVRQRLRLAAVSPRLLELYVAEEMTLEHVMAFTLTTDHARQEQVWEAVKNGYNPQPYQIRRMLTETAVHAANDRRAAFVGVEAYEAAGGEVTRDLFENDRGGWLQDPGLLDRLVQDKLKQEAEALSAEGWKWISVAVDFPYGHTNGLRRLEGETVDMSEEETARRSALQAEFDALEAEYAEADELPDEVDRRLGEIEAEIEALDNRPIRFDPAEIARAGVFVSLNRDGGLDIERGYVRPEDEAKADQDRADQDEETPSATGQSAMPRASGVTAIVIDSGLNPAPAEDDDDGDAVKPLSERLLAELSAHRTVALRNAVAARPDVAFRSVLHGMCLRVFYHASSDNCMEISADRFRHGQPGPRPQGQRRRAGVSRPATPNGRLNCRRRRARCGVTSLPWTPTARCSCSRIWPPPRSTSCANPGIAARARSPMATSSPATSASTWSRPAGRRRSTTISAASPRPASSKPCAKAAARRKRS